jgi:hypothetical protein
MDRRARRPADERWQRPIDDRWQPSPRGRPRPDEWEDDPYGDYGPPPPRGLRIGPLLVTPTKVLMVVALVGSLAYLAYAITVRDTSSIPLLASGAAVLGLVFAGLAVAGAYSTLQAGRVGSDGRAFAMAFLGGLCAIAAFGCWAAAVVFILVSQSATPAPG